MMNSSAVLIKFEDIAFETTYGLYTAIRCHWREMNRWFISADRLSLKELHKRPIKDLNEYLIKPVFAQMTSKQYAIT